MKKALHHPDGRFMSALREDMDTDLPFVLVDDELAFSLTSQHFYVDGEWLLAPMPPPTDQEMWVPVRIERNRRLQQSDWTQLPDVPLTTKEAWAEYRQALRDITDQPDPFNIVWPVAPG